MMMESILEKILSCPPSMWRLPALLWWIESGKTKSFGVEQEH